MLCAKQQNFFQNLSCKVNMMLSFFSGGCWGDTVERSSFLEFLGVGGGRGEVAGGESVGATPRCCPR